MSMPDSPYINDRLHNVHDSLNQAAADETSEEGMTQGSYRVYPTTKKLAEDICKANGTTLSAFLRKCCEGLVRDYLPGQKPPTR